MTLPPLPVDEALPALLEALRRHRAVVLRAPAGAGKTTRIPPAILDAGLAGDGIVYVLEPRRLAARAAARRVAQERGARLGGEVGYQVRFDRKIGPGTRIQFVTDGLFLRVLQEDPFLESAGAILFDEFHERGLDNDIALAMARRVQVEVRPELRLVAMSATLPAEQIARWLGGCPVVESLGRLFPVRVQHLPEMPRDPLPVLVARAVGKALEETAGDLLVFLPGLGEIRACGRELEAMARLRDLALVDLYGDLPPEQQDAAILQGPRRKVILATNVAETSVTVENVGGVIDSGLARILRFDPSVGLDRLELTRISRSSAEQRAGRAGRTAPGVCYRLWTAHEHLVESEEPEILRADLAGAVLQLRCWGEGDPARFPWFQPPRPEALARADALLRRLGALDVGVTETGRAMARLPAHPRLARLLIEGRALGCPRRAALAAAILAERDPFVRGPGRAEAAHRSDSDLLDRVLALEEFERTGRGDAIHPGAARFVLRARDQLLAGLGGRDGGTEEEAALLRALCAAYPDRLARRRDRAGRRGVMLGGRGVFLHAASAVADAELFLCLDVDAGEAEAVVRIASVARREWLPRERIVEGVETEFDEERGRVVAFRRTRFEDLVLEEAPTGVPAGPEASRLLAEAAARDLRRALGLGDPEMEDFLARVACLREWMPELGLPLLDEERIRAILPALCEGRRSFEDLAGAPRIDFLRGLLTHAQQRALEQHAPQRLKVPSGNAIRLKYERGKPPVLAVRMQELFGLRETPRVAAGRIAVLLHLLAPNGRPQQVTADLASFWDTTYPAVRRELRARYPRHAWPEDPWTAPPERRPRRR